MSRRRDIVIGFALLARSLVACDLAISTMEGLAEAQRHVQRISAFDGLILVMGRRGGRGLSSDPARSRVSTAPVPHALVEAKPADA